MVSEQMWGKMMSVTALKQTKEHNTYCKCRDGGEYAQAGSSSGRSARCCGPPRHRPCCHWKSSHPRGPWPLRRLKRQPCRHHWPISWSVCQFMGDSVCEGGVWSEDGRAGRPWARAEGTRHRCMADAGTQDWLFVYRRAEGYQ